MKDLFMVNRNILHCCNDANHSMFTDIHPNMGKTSIAFWLGSI